MGNISILSETVAKPAPAAWGGGGGGCVVCLLVAATTLT